MAFVENEHNELKKSTSELKDGIISIASRFDILSNGFLVTFFRPAAFTERNKDKGGIKGGMKTTETGGMKTTETGGMKTTETGGISTQISRSQFVTLDNTSLFKLLQTNDSDIFEKAEYCLNHV